MLIQAELSRGRDGSISTGTGWHFMLIPAESRWDKRMEMKQEMGVPGGPWRSRSSWARK